MSEEKTIALTEAEAETAAFALSWWLIDNGIKGNEYFLEVWGRIRRFLGESDELIL